jgi:hypothetical protein
MKTTSRKERLNALRAELQEAWLRSCRPGDALHVDRS